MSEPNDEARHSHRLHSAGLGELRWIGVVDDSALLEDLEQRSMSHPGHRAERYAHASHYVVVLKEGVVEVVADVLVAERRDGTTGQAALAALG